MYLLLGKYDCKKDRDIDEGESKSLFVDDAFYLWEDPSK